MLWFSQTTLKAMRRRKTLAQAQEQEGIGGAATLRRSLTAVDLVLYGVGSSVGAGIFVLVGLGAKIAGPAICISFLGCGMACILTSLAYAEFASRIPVSGSAFTYVYVAFGEVYAWIVGWNLILGYGFTASVTARAWGDYTGNFLQQAFPSHRRLMEYITEFPLLGSEIAYTCSPLSTVIVGLSTLILLRGAKDSSRFNNCMTVTNLSILALVVLAALTTRSISSENLIPFVPHGISGVLQGAGLVFFAFIGFDMVASLSEEVVHPERNMPIGIVGSLIVSTCIYVSVSLAVVGMAAFRYLGETVPIVNALLVNACCSQEQQRLTMHVEQCLADCTTWQTPGLAVVAHIVSGGAIFGLMASCFTSLMGQPRIFYRMAQDGLWFQLFCNVDPVTQVPAQGIQWTGLVVAVFACFVPLEALANLISLGTLLVFTFVDAGVILLRFRTVSDAVPLLHDPSLLGVQAKLERKRTLHQTHGIIVALLLLFTLSLLLASMILGNIQSPRHATLVHLMVLALVAIALLAGIRLVYLPSSWVAPRHAPTETENSDQLHGHAASAFSAAGVFECPWVPVIPLGGVACNAFMMGSLPLSSWFFCVVWVACGVAVYFGYGIHHSTLGQQHRYSDVIPLLEQGGGGESGYESTLNISIRQVPSGK